MANLMRGGNSCAREQKSGAVCGFKNSLGRIENRSPPSRMFTGNDPLDVHCDHILSLMSLEEEEKRRSVNRIALDVFGRLRPGCAKRKRSGTNRKELPKPPTLPARGSASVPTQLRASVRRASRVEQAANSETVPTPDERPETFPQPSPSRRFLAVDATVTSVESIMPLLDEALTTAHRLKEESDARARAENSDSAARAFGLWRASAFEGKLSGLHDNLLLVSDDEAPTSDC